jgi:hypothetical protein
MATFILRFPFGQYNQLTPFNLKLKGKGTYTTSANVLLEREVYFTLGSPCKRGNFSDTTVLHVVKTKPQGQRTYKDTLLTLGPQKKSKFEFLISPSFSKQTVCITYIFATT